MSTDIEYYLSWLLVQYDRIKQETYEQLIHFWPRLDNYNHFEKFIILNLLIIATYLTFSFIKSFSIQGIYAKFMKLVFDLPPVRNYIYKELEKARKEVLKDHPENLLPKIDKIPYKPPSTELGDAS